MNIDRLLFDTQAKITGKTGNSISHKVTFEASSAIELSKDDIASIQERLGYHPAGYGLYKVLQTEFNGKYLYQWECSACCD